jgi:hypothetical protein
LQNWKSAFDDVSATFQIVPEIAGLEVEDGAVLKCRDVDDIVDGEKVIQMLIRPFLSRQNELQLRLLEI